MRLILAGCIVFAVALPGCTARYSVQGSSGSSTASQASVASGSPLGNAIIVGAMLADGVRYYRLGPEGKMPARAPEADPTRKINVQDCTRPVDPAAGNLLCR